MTKRTVKKNYLSSRLLTFFTYILFNTWLKAAYCAPIFCMILSAQKLVVTPIFNCLYHLSANLNDVKNWQRKKERGRYACLHLTRVDTWSLDYRLHTLYNLKRTCATKTIFNSEVALRSHLHLLINLGPFFSGDGINAVHIVMSTKHVTILSYSLNTDKGNSLFLPVCLAPGLKRGTQLLQMPTLKNSWTQKIMFASGLILIFMDCVLFRFWLRRT